MEFWRDCWISFWVAEFFTWLELRKLPLAICTRNSRKLTLDLVEKFAIPCEFICAREDAEPKPSPEGLHLIIQHFHCSPEDTVYIGDYLYDLEASEAAGIPFVLFADAERPNYANRAVQYILALGTFGSIH